MPQLLPLFVIEATGIFQPVFSQTHKFIVIVIAQFLLVQHAMALSYLNIEIDHADTPQAKLDRLSVTLSKLDENSSNIQLKSNKVVHPAGGDLPVEQLSVNCRNTIFNKKDFICDNAEFSFKNEIVEASAGKLSITYQSATETISANASGLKLFSGQATLKLESHPSEASIAIGLEQLSLTSPALSKLISGNPATVDFESQLSGILALNIYNGAIAVNHDIQVRELVFSNEAGDFLGDNIAFSVKGDQRFSGNKHTINHLNLAVSNGEILTPYFYSDFSKRPLKLKLDKSSFENNGEWQAGFAQINDGYLTAKGSSLKGNKTTVETGSIEIGKVRLGDSYAFYFLPVISSELAQLDIEGMFSAKVSFQNNELSDYQLNLSDVNATHLPATGVRKFAFKNFNGQLHNTAGSVRKDSYIEFEQASLFETIEFGQIHIPLETTPKSISVSQTSTLPIFDGELLIEKFKLDFSASSPAVEFEGFLTPVDLTLITEALEWPTMQGKISGVIPAVFYKQRNARIDGTLLIKAFEGNILLKDVEASHLLSSWPVLKADVQFIGIDLEQLTQTFEFGRITGNVDGKIEKLVLENWQPTQFDAVFKSSEKSGRKRISQKAVDNISNLGGAGVAGALSRSFLRFFEDFGYDKIGFSCILRDGICEMDGVAKANQGYYLVKGGGIPRIDVIGHNRQTDWNILVDRLVNITEAGTPSIQ